MAVQDKFTIVVLKEKLVGMLVHSIKATMEPQEVGVQVVMDIITLGQIQALVEVQELLST